MFSVDDDDVVFVDGPTASTSKKACDEDYDFEEIIGSGTFSDVVRGVHFTTKHRRAIKIIDKNKLQTDKQKWRLHNEIALHRICSSPYIVHFQDSYESDTDICIVMELCEGGELFNKIVDKGIFSEREAAKAMKHIVAGVQYLHTLGIVHRDIKPENLLYSTKEDDAIIKLADFGLAKKISEVEGRNMLKASLSGTTAYCAPERLALEHESKAVDIWSTGCILYFMLFGVPPFYSSKVDEDENNDEIFESVLEANIVFPENRSVSDLAKDLILRMLDTDPLRRISADDILTHPWMKGHHLSEAGIVLTPKNDMDKRALLKSSINRVIDSQSQDE
eukprot:TRINITY_DN1055_c0_g1_i1.p1 TRINITY_DN1055_c0_g1~~TRINITY_DN1055_c0_g1_i1.p1  ORF type:complete len:334 (-),score=61.82 TRINITY_DN1055_c0_g1_i1:39-1040(-)